MGPRHHIVIWHGPAGGILLILLFLLLGGCGTQTLPPVPTEVQPFLPQGVQTALASNGSGSPVAPAKTVDGAAQRTPVPSTEGSSLRQLPEISVAGAVSLVAEPLHPGSALPGGMVQAGDRARLVGSDKNGAWLLVVQGNVLGWLSAIYTSTGIATLAPMIVDTPARPCTGYLGALTGFGSVWESRTGVAATVLGTVYRPQPARPEVPGIALKVMGAGQPTRVQVERKQLAGGGELLSFSGGLDGLRTGSRVSVESAALEGEPVYMLGAFLTKDCTDQAGQSSTLAGGAGSPSGQSGVPASNATPIVVVIESGSSGSSVSASTPRRLIVGNTQREGVYLRRNPTQARGANLVGDAWPDGTELVPTSRTIKGDGWDWDEVRDPRSTVGWVPRQYVLTSNQVGQSVTSVPAWKSFAGRWKADASAVEYDLQQNGGSVTVTYVRARLCARGFGAVFQDDWQREKGNDGGGAIAANAFSGMIDGGELVGKVNLCEIQQNTGNWVEASIRFKISDGGNRLSGTTRSPSSGNEISVSYIRRS